MDAARELFASGDMENLTLRRIAQRIEYSATTIYLHFQNKDALVRELCAADFAAFSRRLVQAERTADPLERLKKIAAGYVDFGLQYPAQYRAMFITPAGAEPPARSGSPDTDPERKVTTASVKIPAARDDAPGKSERDPHDFLQAAVFKALAAGIFKPEYQDVALLTQTLWAGVHGVISLHQVRTKHPSVPWRPVQTLADMMIECLAGGMLTPALAANTTWR